MKAIGTYAGAVLLCCASVAMASDLTLTVTGDATTSPGGTVSFQIEGLLSDSLNEGLALFGVDVSVSGPAAVFLAGDASISAGPDPAMAQFVSPEGLNNPINCTYCFGFGGTASGPLQDGNDLVQVGGGTNVIGNVSHAPFPVGTVPLGVGQTTAVLATGTVTMPMTPGTYNINLANGFANVIQQGQTTPPVYATEAVVLVNHVGLQVVVSDVAPVIDSVASIKTHGGSGDLPIDVGPGAVSDVEPRVGGIEKLEVVFDMAMNPGTTGPGNVAVTGTNSGVYGGTVGTALSGDGLTLTITFSAPALADQDCHTVDLAGMAALSGPLLVPSTFVVRGLQGDVDRGGVVATTDGSIIKPLYGLSADAGNAPKDYDTSGVIATTDASLVKPLYGNTPGCP